MRSLRRDHEDPENEHGSDGGDRRRSPPERSRRGRLAPGGNAQPAVELASVYETRLEGDPLHGCDPLGDAVRGRREQELNHSARLGPLAPPRVRFAPGPLPEPEPARADEPAATPVEPSAEDAERGAELAAPIEDEKLRNLVARAAAASLAKARNSRSF